MIKEIERKKGKIFLLINSCIAYIWHMYTYLLTHSIYMLLLYTSQRHNICFYKHTCAYMPKYIHI